MAPVNFVKSTSIKAVDVNIPVHILGMGRYLPSVIVSNADIESETGIPSAMIEKYLGVQKRRRCDPANNERASTIGAKAVIDACKNAGISVSELDLIINASGSQERILPDIGPYIQVSATSLIKKTSFSNLYSSVVFRKNWACRLRVFRALVCTPLASVSWSE